MGSSVRALWKVALLAVAVVALFAAGFASFSLTRSTQDARQVEAQEPPQAGSPGTGETLERFWYVPLYKDEATRPRLDTTLVGITIGPDQPEVAPCAAVGKADATKSRAELAEAAALAPELRLPPRYLPPQASPVLGPSFGALSCGGVIGLTEVAYDFRQSSASQYGGDLYIARQKGERRAQIDVAADRAEVTVIAGRDAVLIHPLTEDGVGVSYAIIAEPWGLTIIEAFGLPIAEVQKIAESLY